MEKTLLFSVTEKDCRFDYYKGSGKGGQKKNKTSNCVRCTHIVSGAVGKAEDGRSQRKNKETAFRRMFETKEFQQWHRLETARRLGDMEEMRKEIERQIGNILIERKKDGKWVTFD